LERTVIIFDQLTYRYPATAQPALEGISLTISAGEVVLLIGPSGSGKSTLLRTLNGLVPHFTGGKISGQVSVAGHNPVALGPSHMARITGMVFQEPESQFVVDVVEDEIAFALENSGVAREEMHSRVDSVLNQLGITHLRSRAIHTLSGGEQQRLAIASALVMQPSLLVLDEPTSQLDDDNASHVLDAVVKLNHELGLTVVISEHRLERVLPFATRVVELAHGQLKADSQGQRQDRQASPQAGRERTPEAFGRAAADTPTRLLVSGLCAGYGTRDVLRDLSCTVSRGEIAALMGPSGSGKTTLLRCIMGLTQPRQGTIVVNGRSISGRDTADIASDVAYLPQNPGALLFADTVMDELNITRRNHGLAPFDAPGAAALLSQLGIGHCASAYPRDLSVGERQRAALGAVVAAQPLLLLLDEPTRGLDAGSKRALADVLRRFAQSGAGVLLVTHDHALVELCASRVMYLTGGSVGGAAPGTIPSGARQ